MKNNNPARSIISAFIAFFGISFYNYYISNEAIFSSSSSGSNVALLIILPLVISILVIKNRFVGFLWISLALVVTTFIFAKPQFYDLLAKNAIQITLGFVFGFFISLGTTAYYQFNDFSQKDESIDKIWANLQVSYQKRFDLIFKLTENANNYQINEKASFMEINQSRNYFYQAQNDTQKIQSINLLEQSFSRIMPVFEAYPNLKADQLFVRLSDEIVRTEDEILAQRNNYNSVVENFNLNIRTIPFVIFKNMLGIKKREYFKVDMTRM